MIPIDLSGKVALVTGVGDNQSFAWYIAKALQAAGELQQDRRCGQGNFFDALTNGAADQLPASQSLPDIPEWSDSEKLKNEKRYRRDVY